jgi:hypothetical protein
MTLERINQKFIRREIDKRWNWEKPWLTHSQQILLSLYVLPEVFRFLDKIQNKMKILDIVL